MSELTFAALGLAEPLLRAVADTGYTQPTPIQAQAIPQVLQGGDLLAAAQTGTGKTAGFTLPLLHRLMDQPSKQKGRPRALVLTPTRELAAQVEESVREYGKYLPLKSMVMFGGVGINPQIAQLRKPVDILVATPGRLLDHAGQKTVDLSGVEILVLDEADRMLDMGFIHDIKKVLAMLPKERQTLLFSATFSNEIKTLADKLLNQPKLVEVARPNQTNAQITQKVHLVDRDRKTELLIEMIKGGDWHQVLVFTRTKHGANRLAEKLEKAGIASMAIHGNKSQGARTKALAGFKDGSLPVLVATDIAARGLDIEELPHVVNYELPNVPEDYVHRIGRTGRAGCVGEAISLVCVDELGFLRDIEKLTKQTVDRFTVPGFEANPNEEPQAIEIGLGRYIHGALTPTATPPKGSSKRREGSAGSNQRRQPAAQAKPRQGDSNGRRNEPRDDAARPAAARSNGKPAAAKAANGSAKPAAGKPRQPQAAAEPRRNESRNNAPKRNPQQEPNGNYFHDDGPRQPTLTLHALGISPTEDAPLRKPAGQPRNGGSGKPAGGGGKPRQGGSGKPRQTSALFSPPKR
ncbi:ATP-dependent RNA helicase RhlE [Vogesella indigofera]|uniref:ATP-dependent RNA helicase RhlE n=1 Tax=Vogesella indigofera TaxID=45465 RepID=A0A495B811_VOGIN|nr:DEAD/DEAH box helicase [Vogesella indigofera]RKQ57102.1 ATP-dependent RNA helicase RhlE [Vogesella indigofera]